MGIFMRMRDDYRRQWSGTLGAVSSPPSWKRFGVYAAICALIVVGTIAAAFLARPRLFRAEVPLAAILFGVAALRQWRKLHRRHATSPRQPRKLRGRGRYHPLSND